MSLEGTKEDWAKADHMQQVSPTPGTVFLRRKGEVCEEG